MSKRIGIFSGTFDPIHVGHVEACLVALGALELDEVLVMIEKNPTRKTNVTSYDHRKKMVKIALQDFKHISFFDHAKNSRSENIKFENTLPQFRQQYPDAQVCLIVGSDMLDHLHKWPNAKDWLPQLELCVVLRNNSDKAKTQKLLEDISVKIAKILPAVWSPISSSTIKAELVAKKHPDGLHLGVLEYIQSNHLYQI